MACDLSLSHGSAESLCSPGTLSPISRTTSSALLWLGLSWTTQGTSRRMGTCSIMRQLSVWLSLAYDRTRYHWTGLESYTIEHAYARIARVPSTESGGIYWRSGMDALKSAWY